MKKSLCLLVVCFSFFALCHCANATVEKDATKEQGYISLNNSVVKEVEPNLATITFAVENTGETANKAVLENNKLSNVIVNALKLVTEKNKDIIKTSNFSVRPVYSTSVSGKRTIKNYTAVNSITVQTKDINKVSKLIDTAIQNGANRTDNLYYSLENDKSICEEQYPILIKEMRDLATNLAIAAGTTVDSVKQLSVSCNVNSVSATGRVYAKAMNAVDSAVEEAALSTPIEAGKIKIRVYANADFYVK